MTKLLDLFDQRLESRWMPVSLVWYAKTITIFYTVYDVFCRRHSLMNRPGYNNAFQIMQVLVIFLQ